ncbi:flagellar basal body rod protein FlgB [Geobacter sp. DSM 9736]|uniref:flagellar basal body rod protein FlgB n=1 Tax=Geobacter sp. DSM 9736 TaxID=1277350 RepID=UPI000B512533|nr:flagellar basal body rod protein FlgB [Geobacter sp. DSM 9736]SNB47065.1 flagellar basal-body rod protein FlgB [Geobacter sp. DSM 9736]
MPLKGIFSTTVDLLGKSLDLRARNHNHLSANVANAETPGYVPSTLSFEGELKQALKAGGKAGATPAITHPRHIPLKGRANDIQGVQGTVVDTPASAIGRDGNAVELENEMSKLMENQIMYNASVQILAKKFEGLKQVIKGGN